MHSELTAAQGWQSLLLWQQQSEREKSTAIARYQFALYTAARSVRNEALRATLLKLRDELGRCLN